MEKNAAAGRTPSSVPMPTPPPASLSPKFGPLSPVHTNSLNDAKSVNVKSEPTNFSLPPSYTEDDRSMSTYNQRFPISEVDQRNERFPTGGKSKKIFFCNFFPFDLVKGLTYFVCQLQSPVRR